MLKNLQLPSLKLKLARESGCCLKLFSNLSLSLSGRTVLTFERRRLVGGLGAGDALAIVCVCICLCRDSGVASGAMSDMDSGSGGRERWQKPEYFLDRPEEVYEPPSALQRVAHVDSFEKYSALYEQSLADPEAFWAPIARQLHFETPWTPGRFCQYNFDLNKGPIFIKWMDGATTNVAYNCLDRHVNNGLGDKIAFFW